MVQWTVANFIKNWNNICTAISGHWTVAIKDNYFWSHECRLCNSSVLCKIIHSLNAISPLLCRLIPKLFFPLDQPQQDAATVKGVGYSEQFLSEIVAPSSDCNGSYTYLQHANINSLPGPFNVCFPYPLSGYSRGCYHRNIDTALSRVVCLLSHSLLTSASKYLTVSVFSFLWFKLHMDPCTVTVSGLNSSVKVSSIWD